MKTIPVALQSELNRSNSRLAKCMRIQRRDGNVYGFTTSSKPLVIGGVRYESTASFNPTDIASALDLSNDDVQIDGLLSTDTVTEDDVRAGRWDYAAFRLFTVCWADLTMGEIKDRAGHLGQVKIGRQAFIAEILGLMEAYDTTLTKVTQPGCRNVLGDAKCGVSLAGSPSRTFTGTVDTCDSDFFTIHDAARTEPDAFFDEGVITFLDGDAEGLSYDVKSYLVGVLVTKTPIAYDVTGASYSMTQGCRRRFVEDCVGTFNNGVRFNGEPWLRGPDALVQVGRHG